MLFLLVVGCHSLQAAHYATLNTGTRLRIEGYETSGAITRLHLTGGGTVDVASGHIRGFEKEEYVPPPPVLEARSRASEGRDGNGAAFSPELLKIVKATGERHGLDPALLHSVIRAESGGNPRAVSPKGARGLMQLMPGTARDLNVRNAFDPAQNVDGGARYLRHLLGLYGNNVQLALAAYNAGPGKVAAYGGIPPYRETQAYVSRILRNFEQTKLLRQ